MIRKNALKLFLVFRFEQIFRVPAGNLANASFVGAKTVNGPLLFKVSTNPAAVSALANVLNDPAATAIACFYDRADSVQAQNHRGQR